MKAEFVAINENAKRVAKELTRKESELPTSMAELQTRCGSGRGRLGLWGMKCVRSLAWDPTHSGVGDLD